MTNIKKILTKNKRVSWFLKDLIKSFCKILSGLLRLMFGFNKATVVFQSWQGHSYADSPRALSEALHTLNPTFTIYWIFTNPAQKKSFHPSYIKPIKANTIQAFKVMATSKFWVDNTFKRPYVCKSKNQVYIQTWHGDRGFKTMFLDTGHPLDEKIIESKECDFMVTGSTFAEQVYRSSIKFEGDFLTYGMPRNDILLQSNNKKIQTIKKVLGVTKTKVVLYAPTFRKQTTHQNASFINLDEILTHLNEITQENWVCLARAHRQVIQFEGITLSDSIIDVSQYEDMADLLLIADLLITDYSSSAGDFALTNKPIILFQNDYDEFTKNDRKLYFDMKDSGYWHVNTQEELIESLAHLDEIAQRNPAILSFYGAYESGNASELIAKKIIELAKN